MANSKQFDVIILAAGKGTRMRSPIPKVLNPVAGLPMLRRVISVVKAAGASEVRVVIGHGQELVRPLVNALGATHFVQENPCGTADAVRCAKPETLSGTVVILNGDQPLILQEDIKQIVEDHLASSAAVSVVSAVIKNPGSYGRIVRHHGDLKAIVEAKDASADTLAINEINSGLYVVSAEHLAEVLPKVGKNNAQGEYYLTDIISLSQEAGEPVQAIKAHKRVAFGVNSQQQLARANKILYRRNAIKAMEGGAVIMDPANTYIEDDVEIAGGAVLYPGCYIKGATRIGPLCVLEPNCFIDDCLIAENVQIKAGSYLESSTIKSRSSIGPYAHLRPGNVIGEEAKIGNFVELKKVNFGDRAKAGHLAYLGDAEIGEGTNIGCGTITCNFAADRKKYKTIIGKNVFVGSDSQFVAPIEIGDGAVIGSGSTITKNVPANALAVARGRQFIKEDYNPNSIPTKESKGSDDKPDDNPAVNK